jgi:exonuclease SbcC
MIRSVQIENFQSHAMTRLEFSPGINALVGDSDCGKSAVMRAILWCVTNQSQGIADISDWCKTKKGGLKAGDRCLVSINTNPGDGCRDVSRIRSTEFNGYEVYSGGDGVDKYEALRTDVPSEVSSAFGIGDVNIQWQMDPQFLVSMGAGEAARYINSLVNLDDIDIAMSAVNSMSRETAQDIRAAAQEVDSLHAEVDSLQWVDRLKELADRAEGLDRSLQCAWQKADTMKAGLLRLMDADRQAGRLSSAIGRVEKALGKVSSISSRLDRAISRCNRLQGALRDYREASRKADRLKGLENVQDALGRAQDALSAMEEASRRSRCGNMAQYRAAVRTASIDLTDLERILPRIQRMGDALYRQESRARYLRNLCSTYRDEQEDIRQAQEELHSLLEGLEGQVCPCCGQEIHNVSKM